MKTCNLKIRSILSIKRANTITWFYLGCLLEGVQKMSFREVKFLIVNLPKEDITTFDPGTEKLRH